MSIRKTDDALILEFIMFLISNKAPAQSLIIECSTVQSYEICSALVLFCIQYGQITPQFLNIVVYVSMPKTFIHINSGHYEFIRHTSEMM